MFVALRKLSLAPIAVIGTVAFGSTLACEDIAVVSNDGRFVVLSGDNFAVKDVGNLWWLGIRAVYPPLPGSTYAMSAQGVRFADPETGNIVIPPSRGSTGVILKELGRASRVASDLAVGGVDAFAYSWWLANARDPRIVRWEPTEGGARVSLLDANAKEIAHRDVTDSSVGRLNVGCEDASGRTIIAGLTTRLIVKGDKGTLESLERADRSAGYRLSDLSLGCSAILVQVDKTNPNLLRMARIDLVSNRINSEFATRRNGRWLLFSEGQRMLEQETLAEEVEPAAFRYRPTKRARILDTNDGATLKETELPAAGDLSHLICRNKSERVVLSAENELHLIDLKTLKVIASTQVPFETYFVM